MSDVSDIAAEVASAPIPAFQKRVYLALLEVPRGRVTTYGALGRRIGCGSAQAIGQALKVNPFAPRVPCHRVVASDGSIGGFHGQRAGAQIDRKRRLLRSEGISFDADGRVVNFSSVVETTEAGTKSR